jgi:hypothetical protein
MATNIISASPSGWQSISSGKCIIEVQTGTVIIGVGSAQPTGNYGHKVEMSEMFYNPLDQTVWARGLRGEATLVVSDEA